jgi:hypothetical protein
MWEGLRRLAVAVALGLLLTVPVSASADPGDLLVANYIANQVLRVNPATGATTRSPSAHRSAPPRVAPAT